MKTVCMMLLLGAAAMTPAQTVEERDLTNARLLFEEGQQRLMLGQSGMAKVTFETLLAVYPESKLVSQAKEGIRTAEELEAQAPTVTSIRFVNFKKVKAQDIATRLRDREARLALDQPCDARCVDEAQNIVSELVVEKGHLKSRVLAEMRTVSAWAIEITFRLKKS
jgi:hypothetical protein